MVEFKCKRCGKCCGIVPFSKQEYNAIRDIAKKMHISFVKEDMMGKTVYFPKHTYKKFLEVAEIAHKQGRLIDNQTDGLRCPFLDYDEPVGSGGPSYNFSYRVRQGSHLLYSAGDTFKPCLIKSQPVYKRGL